jgi:hypothetical protein
VASIAQFLLGLAQNPRQSEAFRASPSAARAAMTAFGLSAAQQNVVLSNDPARIAKAIQSELHANTPADVERLMVPISFCFAPPQGP